MTEIERWLREGAGVREGLRLLSVYKPNPYLARMVERHPEKYRNLLVRTLTGTDLRAAAAAAAVSSGGTRRSFREEWPFLSNPDCPMEMKILANDKITAWTNYAIEHERLFSCFTPEQCLETAKKCVLFYQQNRKIFSEFAHYKETGQVLGKHPVFAEVRRLQELRTAGPFELLRRQKNLRSALSRLKGQVRSGDRPDLDTARAELLAAKERELAEVERMIDNYKEAYGKRTD